MKYLILVISFTIGFSAFGEIRTLPHFPDKDTAKGKMRTLPHFPDKDTAKGKMRTLPHFLDKNISKDCVVNQILSRQVKNERDKLKHQFNDPAKRSNIKPSRHINLYNKVSKARERAFSKILTSKRDTPEERKEEQKCFITYRYYGKILAELGYLYY